MTRSSVLATNVTPEAFSACRSHGARNHGSAGSRASCAELASTSAVAAMRGSVPAERIAATGSSLPSSWLDVAATADRS